MFGGVASLITLQLMDSHRTAELAESSISRVFEFTSGRRWNVKICADSIRWYVESCPAMEQLIWILHANKIKTLRTSRVPFRFPAIHAHSLSDSATHRRTNRYIVHFIHFGSVFGVSIQPLIIRENVLRSD